MATGSLLRTIRVLFWKNWRTRARESVLNKRRPTTSGVWLFPPMILDTIVPLLGVLGLLYLFCEINEQVSSASSEDSAPMGKVLVPYVTVQTTVAVMTMLPLLLTKTNRSILVVDRPDTRAFVSFLDTELAQDPLLGLLPISTYTRWFPVNTSLTPSELDTSIEKYVKQVSLKQEVEIYAAIDLRRTKPSDPLQSRLFFNQDDNGLGHQSAPNDQVKGYWTVTVHDGEQDRYVRFPQTLPWMNMINAFLRTKTSTPFIPPPVPASISLSPKKACRELNFVLEDVNLRFTDMNATGNLGNTTETCLAALQSRQVRASTLRFLSKLVQQRDENDQLFSFTSTVLPKKPPKLIHGELETNIIFYLAFLFLWPYNRLVRDIVLEKEKQLKEYLLIMGVAPMALLVSWFLLYWGAVLLVVAAATYVLSDVMFAGTRESQVSFFALLSVFATAILLFGVSITPIFNKTGTAAAAAPIIYMLMGAVGMIRRWVGEDSYFTPLVQVVAESSAPRVLMDTLREIAAFDATNGKVRPIPWTTVEGPVYQMVAQCGLYLVMGWYFENVFPRSFGVQQPWYFIILPSYWFSKTSSADREGDDELAPLVENNGTDGTLREMPLMDYIRHFKPILLVHNLWKRYSNGTLAVKGISFGVKKGEIFGLLGPNGAGKSTTLSILCGMYTPTQGDAFVGSTSVSSAPLAIRKSLSVCFQQNILYDALTVWEHLQLVYSLKTALGVNAIDSEAWEAKLAHFGMDEKKDALSKTLSGGQKRKLSLVLALMDQSRVVLLDEPTAGMDIKARVDTWDALKKAVQHRAVILTTHSMQEAQALCENIGIVAHGELKCCGSSLFLREKFGVGYKLTIVHGTQPIASEKLLQVVQRHVSSVVVASSNKWETRLQLNSEDASLMIPCFDELDRIKQKGGIKSYSVTATDLEDVFVRVTEGDDVYNHVRADEELSPLKPVEMSAVATESPKTTSATPNLSDAQAMPLQLGALLSKRVTMIKRSKRSFATQYIWPIILFGFMVRGASRMVPTKEKMDVITTLPSTASKSVTFLAAYPSTGESTKELLAQLNSTDRSRIIFEVVDTAQTMMDHMMERKEDQTFFSSILVKEIVWPNENNSIGTFDYSVFYNDTIPHSLFVSVDLMSRAYCLKIGKTDCHMQVMKTAFPSRSSGFTVGSGQQLYAQKKLEEKSKEDKPMSTRMMFAFYVLLTLSSVTAVFVSTVVKEREMGLKRMQYLHLASNRAALVYWISHYLFDYAAVVVSWLFMLMFTYIFHMQMSSQVMIVLSLGTFIFGKAIISFSYLVSLIFGSHSTAQTVMSYVSLFQLLGTSIIYVLGMIPGICGTLEKASTILDVFPLFAYGRLVLGLATMELTPMRHQCVGMSSMNDTQAEIFSNAKPTEYLELMKKHFGGNEDPSPWDWDVSGKPLTYLVCSTLAYIVLLFIIDNMQMYPTILQHKVRQWFGRGKNSQDEDNKGLVQGDVEASSIITVNHVSKVYNPRKKKEGEDEEEDISIRTADGQVIALDDVSFTVERNDCVALLGVNGSGKSTTFEILTSGISPNQGKVLMNGINVTLQPQEASQLYGYCPQTNIYFNEMTVMEHLVLFYRLRTRTEHSIEEEKRVIQSVITSLDLFPVQDTTAMNLSGGNKRRMMLALSLLNDQVPLLLMDEPSSGVDVVARRLMWRVLHQKRQSRQEMSCLFTTHSMEEAEAVCANAVVLNRGKVVWSGSIPELKHRAACGISIGIRLDTTTIWETESVRYYTEKVRAMLISKGIKKGSKIPAEQLEHAWTLCREHYPRTRSTSDSGIVSKPRPQGTKWIASLLARLEQESKGPKIDFTNQGIDLGEFVKEWLVKETFATIETQIFEDVITSRSGQDVRPVELQNDHGSGSHTSAVYETNCTDKFTMADAFRVMEGNKVKYGIAKYSISELSLERVFEQFT